MAFKHGKCHCIMAFMTTTLTLDKAGRVVLPKPIRDEMQLRAGDSLELESSEDRIVLRYLDECNGSMRGIAGILNEGRNVLGMMPHPERAADKLLGGTDGLVILRSLVENAPRRMSELPVSAVPESPVLTTAIA